VAASRQLAFDLAARPALGRGDFFAAPANRLALAQIDRWPAWPGGRLAVVGPAGSGKTHLARVWAARSAARIVCGADLPGFDLAGVPCTCAVVVEDVDRVAALEAQAGAAEEALFHLCNHLGRGGALMVTGRTAPAFWPIALRDLASRLAAIPVATLDPPDDALLAAVLVKLFADRGVGVGPDVIRYLVVRIDRSFAAAEAAVARLNRTGLARRRPITVRLAAEMLAEDRPPP